MAKKIHAIEITQTKKILRYVEADSPQDAEDRFWDAMTRDGDFALGLRADLAAEIPEALDIDACECNVSERDAGDRMIDEISGADALRRADRHMAGDVREMRWGSIVARRFGRPAPHAEQGLYIGRYDEDGEFIPFTVVEEDRMSIEEEIVSDPYGQAAFPTRYRFESQLKVMAWDHGEAFDSDPAVDMVYSEKDDA